VEVLWLAFVVEYSPDAEDHLRALTARQRSIILDSVQEPEKRILVRAVGVKTGRSVRIGGQEVQL
jgi:mRNA-degrading endonuclease RelE of RelBE toxin-antitoxin system